MLRSSKDNTKLEQELAEFHKLVRDELKKDNAGIEQRLDSIQDALYDLHETILTKQSLLLQIEQYREERSVWRRLYELCVTLRSKMRR